MKWMFGFGALFACVICGFLGLTAGINMNPQSTVKFVPDWGSLADWVAGIGSMCAVFATVYFGWKQRQELLPKLSVKVSGFVMPDGISSLISSFSLKLANSGSVPIDIDGVCFHSDYSNDGLWLDPTMIFPGSESFITSLAPGKGVSVLFNRAALQSLKAYVRDHCAGNSEGLKLTVITVLKSFTVPVDSSLPKIQET